MNVVREILDDVVFYADKSNARVQYAEYTMPNGEEKFSNIESDDFRAFLRVSYADETNSFEQLDEKQIIQMLHDQRRCFNQHKGRKYPNSN